MKSSIIKQKCIEYLRWAICWVYSSDQNCQNCLPWWRLYLNVGRQTKTNKFSKRNIVYVELISANGKSSAYWNNSGKAWYQALHELKYYYLNIYTLKYHYCYLTCEPQCFSSVEWVVMNTWRGIIRTKWNQALSLVLGTKVLLWLSLTFLRLLPQAHSILALWGRVTVVSASFLVTCLQGPMEEENPASCPQPWVMGQNTWKPRPAELN